MDKIKLIADTTAKPVSCAKTAKSMKVAIIWDAKLLFSTLLNNASAI